MFLSYVLSFVYLGIYWNNHHHMLCVTEHVSGGILWANLHLLFWLSLVPFVTGWMGENHFAPAPTALYGVVLLLAAIAYYILQRTIIHGQGPDSLLARAVGRDLKGKISPVIYVVAMPAAFVEPWIADALYVLVALIWLVPDRRIERAWRSGQKGRDVELVRRVNGAPAALALRYGDSTGTIQDSAAGRCDGRLRLQVQELRHDVRGDLPHGRAGGARGVPQVREP